MLLMAVAFDTMLEEPFTRGANGGVRNATDPGKSPTGPVANLLFSTTAIPTEASADTNSSGTTKRLAFREYLTTAGVVATGVSVTIGAGSLYWGGSTAFASALISAGDVFESTSVAELSFEGEAWLGSRGMSVLDCCILAAHDGKSVSSSEQTCRISAARWMMTMQPKETPIHAGRFVGGVTPLLLLDPRRELDAALLPPKKSVLLLSLVLEGGSINDEADAVGPADVVGGAEAVVFTTPAGPTGCFSSTIPVPELELIDGKSFSSWLWNVAKALSCSV